MKPEALRRRRRLVRWIFFFAILGALWFGLFRRYTFMALEIATVHAMEPAMHTGARHLIDKDPPWLLSRDWIVWWRHADGDLFSRVLARPGDVLARRDGRWSVVTAEGSHPLRPELRLPDEWAGRKLGVDQYLLVNDQLGSGWPDSRALGPISREAIRARVIFPLGGGDGR